MTNTRGKRRGTRYMFARPFRKHGEWNLIKLGSAAFQQNGSVFIAELLFFPLLHRPNSSVHLHAHLQEGRYCWYQGKQSLKSATCVVRVVWDDHLRAAVPATCNVTRAGEFQCRLLYIHSVCFARTSLSNICREGFIAHKLSVSKPLDI